MEEVAAGIYRMESDLGPRFMAQYLLVGDERSILVDTGLAGTPDAVLLPALEHVGIEPDLILVSHADLDHCGGSAHDRTDEMRACAAAGARRARPGGRPPYTTACGRSDDPPSLPSGSAAGRAPLAQSRPGAAPMSRIDRGGHGSPQAARHWRSDAPSSGYSGIGSPEPPSSVGKSLSFGRPSFIGKTVDA